MTTTGRDDVSRAWVSESWARIEAWLGEHAAATLATLNGPADPAVVATAEQTLGLRLPAELVASLERHDGAGRDRATPGRFALAGGYGLMSLKAMLDGWRSTTGLLTHLGEEAMVGHWWHPQWVPVCDTVAADGLIIDMRPGAERGRVGVFLSEDGGHFGRWDSFGALLAHTADVLEGRITDDHAVPRTASGRLIWGWSEPRAADPRSVLALAAQARREAAAANESPEADEADGVTVARRTRPAPPAPGPRAGPEWILDHGRCCITFARGLTEAGMISRLGGDPADTAAASTGRTAEQVAAYEASWVSGYRPVVRVGRAGDAGEADAWVFAFEQRHEEGLRDEALRRLSAGTTAVSVGFTGMITKLGYAEDGVVIGRFDSRWPQPVAGMGPGGLRSRLEQAGLLPNDPERLVEDEAIAAVALAVSLGPGEFDPRVLRWPLRSAPLLPLLGDPGAEPRRLPVQADPDLVAAIEFATEDQLRPAVARLARRQAAESGLDAHPEIVAAIREAERRPAGPVADDSALGILLRGLHADANAACAAFGDLDARDLITLPERRAWGRRSAVARGIETLLARPAAVAAYLLADSPGTFDGRQAFLDDLAGVTIPADATRQLERAEQERRDSQPRVRWSPRASRRNPRPVPPPPGERS